MEFPNYDQMSVDELEKAIQNMAAEVREIKKEQKLAHLALDAKITAAEVARKLALMSDAEKLALVQAIKAEGVKSGEGVGIPGAK